MLFKIAYEVVLRGLSGISCAAGAGWIVWRGNAFDDGSILVPVMCCMSGLALALTGLAVTFPVRDPHELQNE